MRTDRTESKERRLRRYLRRRSESGEFYFKSRQIADEVDLSTKEIGALMARLLDSTTEFDIEKWGYTNGTTWRITPD